MSNWMAVAISFAYVFLMLGLAETLRRVFGWAPEFTRKFIHIAVGMWAFGTAAFFSSKWYAIICPAVFVALNFVSYKYGLFLAMESNDKSNLGTVYFPIAFVLIILAFFDQSKTLMVAALMPMTWGDSFAAIIGKRYGRRRYRAPGGTRSLEGSLAMLVLGLAATYLALTVVTPGVSQPLRLVMSIAVAVAAALVEAVSPLGLDNLLVPLVSSLVLVSL